eukprot:3479823-Prymnesium_polylepis.1
MREIHPAAECATSATLLPSPQPVAAATSALIAWSSLGLMAFLIISEIENGIGGTSVIRLSRRTAFIEMPGTGGSSGSEETYLTV